MNKRKLAELGGTFGAAAVVAVIAARAAAPPAPAPQFTSSIESPGAPRPPLRRVQPGRAVRLVSCGDSRRAHVEGADEHGTITLGPGAAGRCTLLFAEPWEFAPTCGVTGGTAHALTTSDLVIADAGSTVAYQCRERGATP